MDLLLVVDLQLDFCPGGALPVPGGDAVIPVIHRLAPRFPHIVLTQDWHPPGHISFASAHPGRAPFTTIPTPAGPQRLWPDHCLQGSPGAALHPSLHLPHAELILRKGFRPALDSYSAFFENDRTTPTGLAGYCRDHGFTHIYLAGLAYDFCVGYSALDARRAGFHATVIKDASRPIDVEGSLHAMETHFAEQGVTTCTAAQLA